MDASGPESSSPRHKNKPGTGPVFPRTIVVNRKTGSWCPSQEKFLDSCLDWQNMAGIPTYFFPFSGVLDCPFLGPEGVWKKRRSCPRVQNRPSFFLRGEDILIRTECIPMNEFPVGGHFAGVMTITSFK